ncbi:MAG: glycoside hydrolase family 97 N-terminal domain-containing protein [Chitinophagaceae bacterium]|nr:glycoside hydrolase family 97 N-terminal domain-containing protein [Chitinophagaceae bacterium]
MKFIRSSEKKNTLVAKLGSAVKKKGVFSTPWRYVMIADHPAKLLENSYFVIDMNKPNRLQDVSRIKPGKVI